MSKPESRCECAIVNRTIAPIIQRCAFCRNLEAEVAWFRAHYAALSICGTHETDDEGDGTCVFCQAMTLEAENERLKVSMLNHFTEEHLAGDGPEIQRWKDRGRAIEQENERLDDLVDVLRDDEAEFRHTYETEIERLKRELAELKQNEDHFAHDIEMLDRHLKVAVEALDNIYNMSRNGELHLGVVLNEVAAARNAVKEAK